MTRPRTGPRLSGTDARGSGTTLNLSIMVVLLVIAAAVATFAGYAVARHQATNAADLAALAGAQAEGSGAAPCPAASRVAAANRATITDCSMVGSISDFVVTVRVRVDVAHRLPGLDATVEVEANAGPVR